MNEKPPRLERDKSADRYLAMTQELCDRGEIFPFPGISPDSYAILKRDSEEFPDFACDIDLLIKRFTQEGIRVIASGNKHFYVIPGNCTGTPTEIESLSVFLRHMEPTATMDPGLRECIELSKIHPLV